MSLIKITIRRTRSNIANEPDYVADLAAQGVSFPKVAPPHELVYYLDDSLDALFWDTLDKLQTKLAYARYRAIEFLAAPEDASRYGNAAHVAQTLAGVYRVHMVKRLESSFFAFKKSVATLLRITNDMLSMLAADKVLIIPDIDVTDYLEKGRSLDEILDYARERGIESASFPASAFRPDFKTLLESDRDLLIRMQDEWSLIDYDPKFDAFRSILRGELFRKTLNPAGKLVVFSESVDTLTYLKDKMAEQLGRSDILLVSATNRDRMAKQIRASFDANAPEKSDAFNIILASDVLAEGINLHRANVIVNYDTPWNATRLMQRIGRVNRIGSSARSIHNYMFHPSQQGNAAIGLYQNSVIKLQGFRSALGEDTKIFSHEEMLRTFKLFDTNVKDSVDDALRFIRIVRKFRAADPAGYARVKNLPMKCRAARKGGSAFTVAYLAAGGQRAYYAVKDGRAADIGSMDALKLLEASADERAIDWTPETLDRNYGEVATAIDTFTGVSPSSANASEPVAPSTAANNKVVASAQRFVRDCSRWVSQGCLDSALTHVLDSLGKSIAAGSFVQLERAASDLARKYRDIISPNASQAQEIQENLLALHKTYCATAERTTSAAVPADTPTLIISETFTI